IFRREEAVFDRQVIRFGHGGLVNHQTLFLKKAVYLRLGGYRYKEFKNCCDFEYLMRLIEARCKIGHIPRIVVSYRYHEHGQSADLRVGANMGRESALIRKEYGVPGGRVGDVLLVYARIKRQLQKLLIRGKCDLVPGERLLRK